MGFKGIWKQKEIDGLWKQRVQSRFMIVSSFPTTMQARTQLGRSKDSNSSWDRYKDKRNAYSKAKSDSNKGMGTRRSRGK